MTYRAEVMHILTYIRTRRPVTLYCFCTVRNTTAVLSLQPRFCDINVRCVSTNIDYVNNCVLCS